VSLLFESDWLGSVEFPSDPESFWLGKMI